MKKIIAILLSMMLLLGCGAAIAEETAKTTIGTISINGAFTLQCGLPEGYQVKPILLNQDHVIAVLVSEDETKPVMTKKEQAILEKIREIARTPEEYEKLVDKYLKPAD